MTTRTTTSAATGMRSSGRAVDTVDVVVVQLEDEVIKWKTMFHMEALRRGALLDSQITVTQLQVRD
jgi:hypothetical protein